VQAMPTNAATMRMLIRTPPVDDAARITRLGLPH